MNVLDPIGFQSTDAYNYADSEIDLKCIQAGSDVIISLVTKSHQG